MYSMSDAPWEFWIDVGGTFTDCLARTPDGSLLRHKLLSSGVIKGSVGPGSTSNCIVDFSREEDPAGIWAGFQLSLLDDTGNSIATETVTGFDNVKSCLHLANELPEHLLAGSIYELACGFAAPVIAVRYMLGLQLSDAIPPVSLRLGTTQGTNALLTRTGARAALVTTRGFGDLLEIGYQDRPRLFDLTVLKPKPLVVCSVEINERVTAEGEVLQAPDRSAVRCQLQQLRSLEIESLAICLLHADLFPTHEELVAEVAAELGFVNISCSSEVAPMVKIVPRAETTVVDAYLDPVLREYAFGLGQSLPRSQIRLMTSAGGLVSAETFRGHQSVLSGPAGGVVGYARAAQAAGFERAIGFDMGGTSTDVSRFDGSYEFEFETLKAGVRLVTPTLAINTVAAGGGSICSFDGAKLTVGPASAGADPGPACYGRGGPLTVTDLNFYLGRIALDRFPFALCWSEVEHHLQRLSKEVADATGEHLTEDQLAAGLLKIANTNMVSAVRGVSVAKGADPSDYGLVAFGGAAGQHACVVARELGMRQILLHPDAGILSAYGIGLADIERHAATGITKLTTDISETQLTDLFAQLTDGACDELIAEGFSREQLQVVPTLDLRYQGTDEPLNVPYSANFVQSHEQIHKQRYGYIQRNRPVEIVAARVNVVTKTGSNAVPSHRCPVHQCKPTRFAKVWFEGQFLDTPRFNREALTAGNTFSGPALVAEKHSTIVIEPGWQAEMLTAGDLLLTDQGANEGNRKDSVSAGAVIMEVFNNLLAGIAEQMGHVLRRTAGSVNVKERLDFSCGVFTAKGELVANAPHVPVHLGAMGSTVRALLTENLIMKAGDVFVTNDPFRGGSHLPDVTVVTPVHHPTKGNLLFFTACRAHHAEIGGVRPGSMPPQSFSLAEEGVLISNFALVQDGEVREEQLRQLLSTAPYPSRRVEENLADIRAQVAANQQGARDLIHLVERYTLPVVETNMRAIQHAAESKVRKALARFNQRAYHFTDYLETSEGNSIPIQVQITFQHDADQPAATIDFSGTAPVVSGNLNANRAIVTAAVLYVLRLLVDEDIPLNEGASRAVEIILPTGLLDPPVGPTPETTPAVAAGNVETSQRIVDVLLGALGVAGASQGTMNNLLFGNQHFGYYETICGGAGATIEGPGADAVQVHMTNTRSTDPEILERRMPVRLWEFSIRRDSGGAGQHRGGDGAVRRMEFLKPLEVSLITQRRGPYPPYGCSGGEPGRLGLNQLQYANGNLVPLSGICEIAVAAGDLLILQTPGGGGFGKRS